MVDKQQLAAMGEHMREMEECKPEFKVPDGWQLVPVDPTEKMIDESIDAGRFDEDEAVFFWASMLAAAPEYKP